MSLLLPEKGLARSSPEPQLEIAPLAAVSLRSDASEEPGAIREASTDTLGADWPAIFGTPPPPEVEEPAPEPQATAPEEPDLGPFVSEEYTLTGSVLGADSDLAFIRDTGEELIVRLGSTLPGGGEVIAIAADEVRVQHGDGSVSLIVPPNGAQDSTGDMQFAEGAPEPTADPPERSEEMAGADLPQDRDDDWDATWEREMQDMMNEGWDEGLDDGWDGQWNEEWDHMVDDDHEPTPEEMGQ